MVTNSREYIINKVYIDCNRFDILILKNKNIYIEYTVNRRNVLMLSNKECNSTDIAVRIGVK